VKKTWRNGERLIIFVSSSLEKEASLFVERLFNDVYAPIERESPHESVAEGRTHHIDLLPASLL
jgi:hypothetical protein